MPIKHRMNKSKWVFFPSKQNTASQNNVGESSSHNIERIRTVRFRSWEVHKQVTLIYSFKSRDNNLQVCSGGDNVSRCPLLMCALSVCMLHFN